jgi:hypothetical protein
MGRRDRPAVAVVEAAVFRTGDVRRRLREPLTLPRLRRGSLPLPWRERAHRGALFLLPFRLVPGWTGELGVEEQVEFVRLPGFVREARILPVQILPVEGDEGVALTRLGVLALFHFRDKP